VAGEPLPIYGSELIQSHPPFLPLEAARDSPRVATPPCGHRGDDYCP
jgi:hypothetical protein